MTARPRRPAGPPPAAATLHEAALTHLSRFAATQAGLLRVLERRIDRWARAAADEARDPDEVAVQAAGAREAARSVVVRLASAGAVDDAVFAASRARSLSRAGRSRRAAEAHLAAKGVPAAIAQAALPADEEREFAAALAHAKRRRLGPFAPPASPEDDAADDRRQREQARERRALASLARAGFAHEVARQVLQADAAQAEQLLRRLKAS